MKFEVGNNEVYLKDQNGTKVAYVCFEKCGENEYNIYSTYVDESMRGQNIASQMLDFTINRLKIIGAVKVFASCNYASHWLEKNDIQKKKNNM